MWCRGQIELSPHIIRFSIPYFSTCLQYLLITVMGSWYMDIIHLAFFLCFWFSTLSPSPLSSFWLLVSFPFVEVLVSSFFPSSSFLKISFPSPSLVLPSCYQPCTLSNVQFFYKRREVCVTHYRGLQVHPFTYECFRSVTLWQAVLHGV